MEDKLSENIDKAIQEQVEREKEKAEKARIKVVESQKRRALFAKRRRLLMDINRLITERYLINEELKTLRVKNYNKYSHKIREKREMLDKILMELNPVG